MSAKPKQTKNKTASRRWRLYFTGLSMGMADLVPGVSGGTIAFLYGIYDELLYSIKTVTGTVPKLVLRLKFKEALKAIPFEFLLPVFAGIITAIFGLVRLFTYLLDTQPVLVWSLFFGLVVGSAYVVSKRIPAWNTNRVLLLLAGLVVTFILVGLPGSGASANPLSFFLTGMIASCAMILPGISGSLIMVMLGQYENVIGSVEERNVLLMAVFALGAVAGLAVFARLLSWLLKHHHSATIAFLIGVMAGSLRKVWPWRLEESAHTTANYFPGLGASLTLGIVLMAVGFLLVWKLEKLGIAKEHQDIADPDFSKEIKSQHD